MSEKSIATSAKSDNSFPAKLTYIHNSKVAVKFHGNCVKQDKVSFTHGNAVNAFIVYELNVLWSWGLHFDFTLKHRLFGALKLTKNADPDKYVLFEYRIGFSLRVLFSIWDLNYGKCYHFLMQVRVHQQISITWNKIP